MITKTCTTCKVTKNIHEFHSRNIGTYGKDHQCAECSRKRHRDVYKNNPAVRDRRFYYGLKRNYGVGKTEYNSMLKIQDNKCAICNKPFVSRTMTHVDHCHKTNAVRELLCSKCNNIVGVLEGNEDIIKLAHKYIEKHVSAKPKPRNKLTTLF